MDPTTERLPAAGVRPSLAALGAWAARVSIMSFARQIRVALGVRGVAWASAAAVLGLVCCAVSLVVVARSLDPGEVNKAHEQFAAYALADDTYRDFMRSIMGAGSGSLPPADRMRVREGWQSAKGAIDRICGRPARPAELTRLCSALLTLAPRLDPEIDALALFEQPLPASAAADLLALGRLLNGVVAQGMRVSEGLARTMSDQFAGAILALALSTVGFAGAGVILTGLVGRASMLHQEQWQKAAAAAEHAGRLSRRLEAQLIDGERRRLEREALVGSLSDVVTRIDAETGIVTFVSAASADLCGLPPEKIVGTPAVDYVAEEDRAAVRAQVIAALKAPGSSSVHLQFRVNAAGRRRVEARFRKIRTPGGQSSLIGVTRDVEERVHLAEQLDRQTTQLRSIVESSGAFIVLLDGDLRVVMVNSAFAALAGIAPADAAGRSLKEVVDCSFDEGILEGWRAGASLLPVRFTNRLSDGQGRERQISCTATPIADSQGRLANVVFLGIDDTDRVEAEQALFDAQRYATLGEMAATVAHEIAQPLQVINIACDAALEELSDDSGRPPDRAYLTQRIQRVARQIERANDIVSELRAFVRGTSQDAPAVFALSAAVGAAAELARLGLARSKVALSVSLPDDLPMIRGHAGRFEQVLVNLINNARDAGATTIDLLGYAVPAGVTRQVFIRVEDNGPGISDKVLPHLFERFVTTKPPGVGTGLGLRICRRIVEDMGGSITAGNRREGGAYFDIVLPAARA